MSIERVSRAIEEWYISCPQDVSQMFLQTTHNYVGTNFIYKINSYDEVVMVYKRGFDSYECVLDDKANVAQLEYSDSYTPFSCSIFEQRFKEEYNQEKDINRITDI